MEMPPALHIAVNSPRSNAIVDLTPLSDVLESWSHPWHALQRSLAQGFGVEMSSAASFRKSLSNAKFEPAETASWRLRACAAPPRHARSSG
jgi:hypothetical protein